MRTSMMSSLGFNARADTSECSDRTTRDFQSYVSTIENAVALSETDAGEGIYSYSDSHSQICARYFIGSGHVSHVAGDNIVQRGTEL